MASYLVDIILLVALLFTSIRVTRMHRELVHLRSSQGDFSFVLGKTTETVDDMVLLVREFSADGKHLVSVLGDKIDEARKAIMDIEARSDFGKPDASTCADQEVNELTRRGVAARLHG